mgnify:CR=1 FL=1
MYKIFIFFCLLFLSFINVRAQNFEPALAYNFVYSTPLNAFPTDEVSCHAFRAGGLAPTAWGDVDVYLSGRGSKVGEVTIQFTQPDDPTNVVFQKSIVYGSDFSLQVGAVQNSSLGTMQILVAYLKHGFGFKIDVYDITASSINPIVLTNTINLTSPGYGYYGHRIRMDSRRHNAVVVWDNPFVGLQTIVCEDGNWGGVVDLDATYGEMDPDVALCDIGSNTSVRFVSRNTPGTAITTSIIDFSSLMITGGTVAPAIEDVNYLAVPINSKISFDSKDYDNNKNWAYTYTDQNNSSVYVRLTYYQVYPGAYTVVANDGSQGNAGLTGQYSAYSPALHYGGGPSGVNDEITVGWYNTDGTYNSYIATSIKPDGNGAINTLDYMELPSFSTASPYPNIGGFPYYNSGIAFSKLDQDIAPEFLYATYYDIDPLSGDEVLYHAFHKWGDVVFKKELKLSATAPAVYPNPFVDELHTTLTLEEQGTVELKLVDFTGRAVSQKRFNSQTGKHSFSVDGLQNVIPGTYFLTTTVNGKNVNTQIVVKH